jgi:hypothetical protein
MIKELVNVHLSNVINNIKQTYIRRIMHVTTEKIILEKDRYSKLTMGIVYN